jgi:hypothetical protein
MGDREGLGVVQTRTPSEFAGNLLFPKQGVAESGAEMSGNISRGTVFEVSTTSHGVWENMSSGSHRW